MKYPTHLTDEQWKLLEPVLGVGGSRGPQPRTARRRVVDAVLYQARIGCQWRYLPAEFGPWNTIWRTFARWRDRGVWQQAVDVLRRHLRVAHGRDPEPSMVMVDCQVTKGGRGGPSFHENHGKYRLCGAKKVVAIDYLGLPVGAAVFGARRDDVGAARELLDELLPRHPRVAAVLGDRGFRGLEGPMLRAHDVTVELKHRDRLPGGFKPIRPLWRVEDCFARLGRWRRLARSFEATPKSATAWVQVAAIGWMLSVL